MLDKHDKPCILPDPDIFAIHTNSSVEGLQKLQLQVFAQVYLGHFSPEGLREGEVLQYARKKLCACKSVTQSVQHSYTCHASQPCTPIISFFFCDRISLPCRANFSCCHPKTPTIHTVSLFDMQLLGVIFQAETIWLLLRLLRVLGLRAGGRTHVAELLCFISFQHLMLSNIKHMMVVNECVCIFG